VPHAFCTTTRAPSDSSTATPARGRTSSPSGLLPEGNYSVRVSVERARGTATGAETAFTVRGPLSPLDVDGAGQQPDGG
jgi:hypothetical protein